MNSDRIMIESIRKGLAEIKQEFKDIATMCGVESERKERIVEAMKDFDPDKHAIVTMEEKDRLNQLKTLSEAVAILAKVQEKEQSEIKDGVNFIKGMYTNPVNKDKKPVKTLEDKKLARKAVWLKPKR
jgi:hypothetical protein